MGDFLIANEDIHIEVHELNPVTDVDSFPQVTSYEALVNPYEGNTLKFAPPVNVNSGTCAKIENSDIQSGTEC